MKKRNFLLQLVLSIGTSLYAQDTLVVHSQFSKDPYLVDDVDTMRFLKSTTNAYDTLLINSTKFFSKKYPIVEIDSIVFQEYDPIDYTTPYGYGVVADAAYMFMRTWYGKEDGMGLSEMGTDLWTLGSEGYSSNNPLRLHNYPLVTYDQLNANNENVLRAWKQFYSGVNLCNIGIKIATDNNFTSQDVRNAKRAELHFLRAFYYWHLVETWGNNIPLVTNPYYYPHIRPKQWPEARLLPEGISIGNITQIYQLIESDLQFAINNLPDSNAYGKANQWIAKAFLARVALTKGYSDPNAFVVAKQLAEEVINSNKFSLVNNYASLWSMEHQNNSEIIWALDYEDPNQFSDVYSYPTNPFGYGNDILSSAGNATNNRGNNNLHAVFVPRYEQPSMLYSGSPILNRDIRNGISYTRFKPTLALFNLFDETKDSRYYGSFQTVWLVNRTNFPPNHRLYNRALYKDTALIVDKNPPVNNAKFFSISLSQLYNAQGGNIGTNSPTNAIYPTLIKHLDSLRGTSPNEIGAGNIQSRKDVYILRLAEMYMIAAEASFKQNQLDDATKYLNQIRIRAAIPGKANEMQISSSQVTLDFILDERAREFAGEQIRWFDLKRTGKLIERVKAHNPDAGQYIQDFHINRPIPFSQLEITPNFAQKQ